MAKQRLRKKDRVKIAPNGTKAIYIHGSCKRPDKVFKTRKEI
jgi:hypothetical protein